MPTKSTGAVADGAGPSDPTAQLTHVPIELHAPVLRFVDLERGDDEPFTAWVRGAVGHFLESSRSPTRANQVAARPYIDGETTDAEVYRRLDASGALAPIGLTIALSPRTADVLETVNAAGVETAVKTAVWHRARDRLTQHGNREPVTVAIDPTTAKLANYLAQAAVAERPGSSYRLQLDQTLVDHLQPGLHFTVEGEPAVEYLHREA